MDELDKIKDYLLRNKVDKFWASTVVSHLQNVIATNTYWISHLRNPILSVHKLGYVLRLELDCTIHSSSDDQPAKLIYTFSTGKDGSKPGHFINISTNKRKEKTL